MGAVPDEKGTAASGGARTRAPRAAAALRYDPARDGAPRVVAAGFGAMAEAILRRAREAGVPQVTSPVAPILARIPPGQEIPPALYEVVARIMALALELDRELAEGRGLADRWGVPPGEGRGAGAVPAEAGTTRGPTATVGTLRGAPGPGGPAAGASAPDGPAGSADAGAFAAGGPAPAAEPAGAAGLAAPA